MAEELGVAPGEPSAAASPGTHCPVTVSQVFSGTSAKSGGSPTGCTFDANASAAQHWICMRASCQPPSSVDTAKPVSSTVRPSRLTPCSQTALVT